MKVDLPLPLSIVVHFRTSFTVKTVWQLFVLLNHEIMSILANLIGLWKLSCFVMTAPKEEQLRNFQRALCASHARKSLVKGERFIRRLHGKRARKSNHVNFNTYLCVSCQPLSLVRLPFFSKCQVILTCTLYIMLQGLLWPDRNGVCDWLGESDTQPPRRATRPANKGNAPLVEVNQAILAWSF